MTDREEQRYEQVKRRMQHYNEPPDTPVEEMWPGVRASWQKQGARRKRFRMWGGVTAAAAGIAAVLTVGVLIGRSTAPRETVVVTNGGTEQNERVERMYRLAAADHFERAENLFLSFRSDASDRQTVDLARELLTSTRLLLDSRAAEDPRVRELLLDLELLLAQMAQLEPQEDSFERGLINEGIENRGMLPRLRRLIPTGPVRAGA